MKFQNCYFHRTALYIAVESDQKESVKLLLENEDVDVNITNVLKDIFFIQFTIH